MKFLNSLFALCLLMLSGCAFGPLVGGETGRTLGEGKHDIGFGYGQAGYDFKYNYGLKPDWDLGLQVEALSLGMRTKYAFINNQEAGWSLAGAFGLGSSIGGTHYYFDVLGSYLVGDWEPYAIGRLVHIVTDPVKLGNSNPGSFLNGMTFPSQEYNYGEVILGCKYWFTKSWNFNPEVGSLVYLSSGSLQSNLFLTANFGYRF